MGYTTWFEGELTFDRPVDPKLAEYINKFSDTRRMKRDKEKIKEIFPNWKELCYKGELGTECEYFVGGKGVFGQDPDDSIINYNTPPENCPGLWCNWIIEDNKLIWNEAEKFYHYVDWLRYLITNFFAPEGYILNGSFDFQGEDTDDKGTITVENNKITVTRCYG